MAIATQSIGILFNAASLASGSNPFRNRIQQLNSRKQAFDVLVIDATMQETHSAASEVTEHPVEVGSDITDHIRPKPIEVRIDGIITNAPLQTDALSLALGASPLAPGLALANAAALALIGKAEFTKDAFNTLRRIRDNGVLVVLNTAYEAYENMAMTDLQIVRDQNTGDALHFTATFRQIVIVDAAKLENLPTLAQDASDIGSQSTSSASGAIGKATDLSLLNMLGPQNLNAVGLTADPKTILTLPTR